MGLGGDVVKFLDAIKERFRLIKPRKPVFGQIPLSDCRFSVIEDGPAKFSDVLSYYDRLKSYAQHEDDLLNSRLNWSLTVHGFLFAIFGVLTGKITDLYVQLHNSSPSPTLLEPVISGLIFLQMPIAIFGALVAYMSRNAIVAAHNAVQHLYAISQFSGPLSHQPKETTIVKEVTVAARAFTPMSEEGIQDGAFLLVEPGSSADQEIVRVTKSAHGLFEASFTKPHQAGATVKTLGFALLPHIISGGAKESMTDGAPGFYLHLPVCAMVLWLLLLALSTIFFATSIWRWCWLLAHFKP